MRKYSYNSFQVDFLKLHGFSVFTQFFILDFLYWKTTKISQEIHSFGPNILKLLVDSLAPSIFGHHLGKRHKCLSALF